MAANSRFDVFWHSTAMHLLSFPAQTCVVSWFGVVDGGSATECGLRRAARLDVVSANFDREAPQTNQSGEHLEVKRPEGRKQYVFSFCGQKKHKKHICVFIFFQTQDQKHVRVINLCQEETLKTHMCFKCVFLCFFVSAISGTLENTYVFFRCWHPLSKTHVCF